MRNLLCNRVLRWCTVTIIIFGGGCFSMPSFQVSVPREVPVGVKGKISNETIRLSLDTVATTLQLQNFQNHPGGAAYPLALWLEIGSTSGNLTLDPSQVILTTNNGNTLRALTFLGPSDAWQSPRAVANGCGPRRYAMGWSIFKLDVSADDVLHGNPYKGIRNPSVGPVPFEGTRCFLFWYDTDPSPDLPFIVSVRGIARDGTAVIIPDLHFTPGTVRKTVIP